MQTVAQQYVGIFTLNIPNVVDLYICSNRQFILVVQYSQVVEAISGPRLVERALGLLALLADGEKHLSSYSLWLLSWAYSMQLLYAVTLCSYSIQLLYAVTLCSYSIQLLYSVLPPVTFSGFPFSYCLCLLA